MGVCRGELNAVTRVSCPDISGSPRGPSMAPCIPAVRGRRLVGRQKVYLLPLPLPHPLPSAFMVAEKGRLHRGPHSCHAATTGTWA